jgi:hypothetical protein
MKPQITIIILLFLQLAYSQNKEIINPKGKWFFGVEIGSNEITSYTLGEKNQSFQGGFLAEYYFAKHWSLSGRIKYFETGVSYFDPGSNGSSGGWFNLGFSGRPASYGYFNGNIIAFPLNINWKFRIFKNLSGNLKLGYVYNIETKSEYGEYSKDINPNDYPKNYESFNIGYGFNYFLNNKTAVYLEIESFGSSSKNNKNKLINFGYKYSFQ